MPVLIYSLLRILLIIVSGVGLYLAGMRGFFLGVGAVVVGALLSYILLYRFKRSSALYLQARGKGHTKFEDRVSGAAAEEDAYLDSQQETPPQEDTLPEDLQPEDLPAQGAEQEDLPAQGAEQEGSLPDLQQGEVGLGARPVDKSSDATDTAGGEDSSN